MDAQANAALIETEIAKREAALRDIHARIRMIKAEKRQITGELEMLYGQQRLAKELGLSEKGVETMRKALLASGVPPTSAVGTPGA